MMRWPHAWNASGNLSEAQGHLSRDSARFTVLADEIHRESAVYLALVDARRGFDPNE